VKSAVEKMVDPTGDLFVEPSSTPNFDMSPPPPPPVLLPRPRADIPTPVLDAVGDPVPALPAVLREAAGGTRHV